MRKEGGGEEREGGGNDKVEKGVKMKLGENKRVMCVYVRGERKGYIFGNVSSIFY